MHALFAPAHKVVEALGAEAVFAVGGAVRAFVLAEPLAGVELDLCTPLLPAEVEARARAAGLAVEKKGAAWGCLTLAGFEVTSFRTERYTQGSRHPKVHFGVPLAADAARRDFTCNAVYLAPDGTLHDPYHGAEHLKNRQVVWVEDPCTKLAEDPIRWWRWLRFSARYGAGSVAQPKAATVGGVVHDVPLTALAEVVLAHKNAVSPARWQAEKAKAAQAKGAVCGCLKDGGVAQDLWPE